MNELTDEEKSELKYLQSERTIIYNRIKFLNKKSTLDIKHTDVILEEVGRVFRVGGFEIIERNRLGELKDARECYAYLLRVMNYSNERIGQIFGITHAAVMYRLRICKKKMDKNAEFKRLVLKAQKACYKKLDFECFNIDNKSTK